MATGRLGELLSGYILRNLKDEFEAQGHKLTGAFENSLTYQVKDSVTKIEIDVLGNDYGKYVNTGVPSNKIPFSGTKKGRGGTSKYIQGLIRFVQLRTGKNAKEAIGIAFAIAKAHKRDGMPTRGSYKHSQNSRRTDFVNFVLNDKEENVGELIEDYVKSEIELLIQNYVKTL